MLFRKKVTVDEQKSVSEKLMTFRNAMILSSALMEAPAFLCIISYILAGNNYLLIFAGIIVAIMLYFFPTRGKIANDLGIYPLELD